MKTRRTARPTATASVSSSETTSCETASLGQDNSLLQDQLKDRLTSSEPPRAHRTEHRTPTWSDVERCGVVTPAVWRTLDDFRRNGSQDGGMAWDEMLAVTLQKCALGGLNDKALLSVGSLFFERGDSSSWDLPSHFQFVGGKALVHFRHVNPHSDGDAVQALQLTPPAPYTGLDTWQRGENVDSYADGRLVVEGTWLEGRTDTLRAEFTAWQVTHRGGTYGQMVQEKLDNFMTWGRAVVVADIRQTVGQTAQQRVVSAMNALMATSFSAIDLQARQLPQVQDEAVIQRVFQDELGLTVDVNVDSWPAGISIR